MAASREELLRGKILANIEAAKTKGVGIVEQDKLKFYEHFIHYINKLKDSGEKIITCGDFNICHNEIDIARPKENANSI